MPISITCPNGHALTVKDDHAGMRVMCPKCQAVTEVPPAKRAPTISLNCPNGHALVVPVEHAGKKVMCPKCQAVTEVPSIRPGAAPPPLPPPAMPPAQREAVRSGGAPSRREDEDNGSPDDAPPRPKRPRAEWEDEDDDRPRKRRRRFEEDEDDFEEEEDRPRKKKGGMKRRQRMNLVNLGLGFHYAGLVVVLIATLLYLLTPVTLPFIGTAPGLFLFLMGAMGLAVYVVTPLLWVTGSILCLFVPPKSGAMVFDMISLILAGVTIPMGIIMTFSGLPPILSGLTLLAAWVLFMLFLRQLANYLHEETSADEALQIIYMFIVLVVCQIVLIVVMFAIIFYAQSFLLASIIGLPAGIALFVFYIKFLMRQLNLIGSIRQVIATRG
jgi:hypothetical protein